MPLLHTAVTSAPSQRASCTAKVPTPPEAPFTSTRLPAATFPLSRTAWSAVSAATGAAAAASKETSAGLRASFDSRATAWCAHAPAHVPNTSWPTAKLDTDAPTAITRPATSVPANGLRGVRSPLPSRAGRKPVTPYQSAGLTEVARTSTSTWSGSSSASSTSPSRRAPDSPYRSWTRAGVLSGSVGDGGAAVPADRSAGWERDVVTGRSSFASPRIRRMRSRLCD